jgi:hypothetical protein
MKSDMLVVVRPTNAQSAQDTKCHFQVESGPQVILLRVGNITANAVKRGPGVPFGV